MAPAMIAHAPKVPSVHDWRTTDIDEVNRRRLRAREEKFDVSNLDPQHPIFSNFRVQSASGLNYSVEIRDVGQRQFACDCVDFRINGLGTCKHVEAVLLHLQTRYRRLFAGAEAQGSTRIEIALDRAAETLRLVSATPKVPTIIKKWFRRDGTLDTDSPETAVAVLQELGATRCPELRISQEVAGWLKQRRQAVESKELRHQYELKVQRGEWPVQETKVPLFPYQREGMLHLAFTERTLLADEMGLGKTIQAIAACALLHRLGKAQRVLVVTPASLKAEWEEQIQRFTTLPYQLVFGGRSHRLQHYKEPPFFTIVNYEQMLADSLDVNASLRPDIVVLDEAQRIKNWSTKTAQVIKRLQSRYAFVLTGTPIENRIDEIHSLMDFLNPAVLGPLFRFNREFYDLDERGRPIACRNLDILHQRIKPYMLRRRKAEVETELPERTDRNHFVPLGPQQADSYAAHEAQVARLMNAAMRRPLTQQEQDKLLRELAMMRMVCDTNYILDAEDRSCPKLAELEKILEECRENDAKVIVFSEWERMLELVRELCQRLEIGFAWHTGSVPQQRRRGEINAFKADPACRVFLSTDSGSTGLNLQNASVVINCDLPWNPAKLEQRIARAWRKHQTRPVTVVNLVAENTIEHRMLDTLATKQAVADSVLDRKGLTEIKIGGGRQAFLQRVQQLMRTTSPKTPELPGSVSTIVDNAKNEALSATRRVLPADRGLAFGQLAHEKLNGALVRCEECYPNSGNHTVLLVVVDSDPAAHRYRLDGLREELFGPGKIDPLAPVLLEVIDRATDEALERLVTAGLLVRNHRAIRSLLPSDNTSPAVQALSMEERQKADAHRTQARRNLQIGRLLEEGGFGEEGREPLRKSAHALACSLAVENRMPEPADLTAALMPPLSHCFAAALPQLRHFVSDAAAPCQPIVAVLDRLLAGNGAPSGT